MTYDHDRDYWRCADVRALIEAARTSGDELCIALGERLDDLDHAQHQLDDMYEELREAQRKIFTLEADLEALERDFEALQDAAG